MPGGLIMQWGTESSFDINTKRKYGFSIPFNNMRAGASTGVASNVDIATGLDVAYKVQNVTEKGFTAHSQEFQTDTDVSPHYFYWWAYGF